MDLLNIMINKRIVGFPTILLLLQKSIDRSAHWKFQH